MAAAGGLARRDGGGRIEGEGADPGDVLRVASYVGEGRKLTQTGNLTLADARALVELLGTGDVMDEQIGDRTFKTHSSAELSRLRLIFVWARKAGVAPTLIGTVYGMNFDNMPELSWAHGYPFALFLMALVSVTLYAVFKRRDWL